MTAIARKQKAAHPRLDLLEAEPAKSLLPLEVRAIGRSGILELMRIGAGLSYKQVGERAGMRPISAMRLIRGERVRPRGRDLERIREVLRAALPAVPDEAPLRVIEEQEFGFLRAPTGKPKYLTLQEAADLLKVKWYKMRRLASEVPELRAIRIGSGIRIPVEALEEYILGPHRVPDSKEFMSRSQVAAFFRVNVDVISYAIEAGRIRARQVAKRHAWRIPVSEVARIAQFGMTEIPRRSEWDRPERRRGCARRTTFQHS